MELCCNGFTLSCQTDPRGWCWGVVAWPMKYGGPQGRHSLPATYHLHETPLGEVIRRLGAALSSIWRDTQLYLKLPSDPKKTVERLGHGLEEMMGRLRMCKLRLSHFKMEVLLVRLDLALRSEHALGLDRVTLLWNIRFTAWEPSWISGWHCGQEHFYKFCLQPFLEKRNLTIITRALVTSTQLL